uniref:Reverse transcriptase domain-containing protein n=1 Tax=Tanacetum cinerariifolium TaxID=118510 RepID=A0A699GYB3_TANCI|nr:reverse transcriptase domain-containing protein [Tanacetum cinerariifolium]
MTERETPTTIYTSLRRDSYAEIGSIINYEDLKVKFQSLFSQQQKFTKTYLAMHNIKQREGEITRAFVTSHVEFLSADLPTTYKGLIEKTYTWIKAKEVATNGAPNDHREGFNRYTGQTMAIGKKLPTNVKRKLQDLVRSNTDIFTWTYANMIWISKTIVVEGKPFNTEHGLNKHKHMEPVKQKKRSLVPDRNDAICKEVEEHMKADILREVKYQTWVSNPIMLGILISFTLVYHPQANGEVEVTNQDIVKGMERILRKNHQGWVYELPQVVWVYIITSKSSNEETSFSLTYGFEAIVPIEISVETKRVKEFKVKLNEKRHREDLDIFKERREITSIREAYYKQKMESASKAEFQGNMGPTWEGAYVVIKSYEDGAYKLETLSRYLVDQTWNGLNLWKFTKCSKRSVDTQNDVNLST